MNKRFEIWVNGERYAQVVVDRSCSGQARDVALSLAAELLERRGDTVSSIRVNLVWEVSQWLLDIRQ